MKKLLIIVPIALSMFFMSCGDDSCEQADWIGTYDLISSQDSCIVDETTTIYFDPVFVLEAGSTATTIASDGIEGTINADDCTATLFFFTLNKDGDKITTSLGVGCDAEYEKR